MAPFCESEQNLIFRENSSISKVFQCSKKTLLLSRLVKNTEKRCPIYSQQDGVKDRYRSGKKRPLSDFYPIEIIFLGVNNGHASKSKCTYFITREISRKRKYINNEIYEMYISHELLYSQKQPVKDIPWNRCSWKIRNIL